MEPNPSTAQARVVVDEWVRAGVDDVVACPGSRNAPFLLALHDADAAGRLRLHMRVDERCAGFLAVGLAARSGRVVPVVVTSGTAVAELHPAVLEAAHAGVALLVVSADRPTELVGTGANQTVEQVGLFSSAVRASIVLPLAEHGDLRRLAARWRATVVRALDRAAGTSTGDPGPVQLDVPLREPLVPDAGVPPGLPAAAEGRPGGGPWTVVAPRTSTAAPLDLGDGVPTLVVAGHGGTAPAGLPPGTPLVAEPSSPLWGRSAHAGPWVLDAILDAAPTDAAPGEDVAFLASDASDAASLAPGDAPLSLASLLPRRVVVLGRPTLHRGVSRLLADPRVEVVAVPSTGAGSDADWSTSAVARPGWTDVAGTVAAVGDLPAPYAWSPDPTHARAWARADLIAAAAVRAQLEDEPWATGPALAAGVVAALPTGALLVVAASNPIRDVALAATPRDDVVVASARGVAGIDGAVSFATGAALAHQRAAALAHQRADGGPAYALLGDVAFVHDAGGLLAGPAEPRPELVIVVADDDGGSIFAGLEPGAPAHAAAFERVFATPHGTDLGALCAAHHTPHVEAKDRDALLAALAPTGRPGVRVVQVAVDRADRRALGERLAHVTRTALTELAGR